jgi:rhodanese-related sulfurtransferase
MKLKLTPERSTKPKSLTPSQLKSQQEKLLILDVRSGLEYLMGHIPSAQRISRSRILKDIPKSQAIAVACLSGHCSLPVAQWLVGQGYPQVYTLQGGLMAWKSQGYPTKMGNQP